MRFLTFEAVQDPDHPDHDPGTGGAFINCFINEISGDPVATASKYIRDSGWIILTKEADSEIDPENCASDDENYEHIVQAMADGEVYVFHSWPTEQLE